ncbi:MAG TPA: phosphonopyruvate decarboxylase [Candidatus Ventricola gallistercoris]|nr:phosphonopyruvate decarboxylase [Candidatus Ventricola gallistercoris]
MNAEALIRILGSEFYAGVPDSQLKSLCNALMHRYGIDVHHHVIAANEGNATALAAGYHLATGKVPVVYMQNSGIGNIVNPVASLLNDQVYAIPCIFVVGWRGEPGVHDEPQHIFQGQVTVKLLEDMGISTFILSKDTEEKELAAQLEAWKTLLDEGKNVAIVVRKGALTYDGKVEYSNGNAMMREEIIRCITDVSGEDVIVSTTGKASRELFEIREANGQSHRLDFLTVGSMGHSSSIALVIAAQKPGTRVWCIDGDGAALMHMGAMAVIGANKPKNFIHVVINNAAHETVGGMPTVMGQIDLAGVAKACGYEKVYSVAEREALVKALEQARSEEKLAMIEVKAKIGSRADLGRPTTTPQENREAFMAYLAQQK